MSSLALCIFCLLFCPMLIYRYTSNWTFRKHRTTIFPGVLWCEISHRTNWVLSTPFTPARPPDFRSETISRSSENTIAKKHLEQYYMQMTATDFLIGPSTNTIVVMSAALPPRVRVYHNIIKIVWNIYTARYIIYTEKSKNWQNIMHMIRI